MMSAEPVASETIFAADTTQNSDFIAVMLDHRLRLLEVIGDGSRLLDLATGNRGTPWAEVAWRFDASALEARVARIAARGGVFDGAVSCADGSCWRLSVQCAGPDETATRRLLLMFARDGEGPRLRAENRSLEASLRDVVAGSPRPALMLASDLSVLAASDAFHDLFATRPSDVLGTPLLEIAGGLFDEAETRAGLAALRAGQRAKIRTAFGYLDTHGHRRSIAIESRRIGESAATMILADIYDETHPGGPLGDSFRILDQVPEAMLVVDRDERIRLANAAAGALFATPAEGLHGRSLAALLPEAGLEAGVRGRRLDIFAEPRHRHVAGVQGRTALLGHTDELALDLTLGPLAFDGLDATVILARRSDAATSASPEPARRVLDRAPVAGLLLDRLGRIRYANAHALSMLGRRGEVEGEDWFRLYVPRHARVRLRDRLEQAVARNEMLEPSHFEYPLRDEHGTRRLIAWHGVAVRDGAGVITDLALIGRDITEQRRARLALEADRAQADEANALKSRVLAATGRDLQQPLQTLSFLHGVLARRVTEASSRAVLATLAGVVKAMSSTVEVLLDVGRRDERPEETKLTDIALGELLIDVRTRFADRAGAKGLELHVVPTTLVARTDRSLLERLLHELVGNAVRYTETGTILVGCRRRDDEVRLVVGDSRATVPVEQLRLVAEQLRDDEDGGNATYRSSAAAINVVRPLSRLPRHRLEVGFTLGRGAMFGIRIPRSTAGAPLSPAGEALPWRAGDRHALVVADERSVRDSVEQLFALEGFEVRLTRTVGEALALLAADEAVPDLIVADQPAVSTAAALRLVRGLKARCGQPVPAVVLVNEPVAASAETLAAEGIHPLRKPVTAEGLLALTAELLRPPSVEEAASAGLSPPAAPGGAVGLVCADRDRGEAYASALREAGQTVLVADDLDALAEATADDPPGCLVLDPSATSRRQWLDTMERASQQFEAPIVVLSGITNVSIAVSVMRAGAFEFLAKPVRDDALRDTVALALRESRRRRREDDDALVAYSRFGQLTPREREVLRLLIAGYSNKAVAAELQISPRTAENHRARIMDKTEARSLAELVRLAARFDSND